ncbi:MAG: proton-conducting transporter membrane subunit [Solirubrobacteraceae bacterium]
MSALYAIGMGALALAVALAALWPSRLGVRLGSRLAAAGTAVGCVLLVIVGLDGALGGASGGALGGALGGAHAPMVGLGSFIGFGHSALRADGLAGIFLVLTGLTGGAVSLTYAELPAGRWLTLLASTLVLFTAVAIGSDNGFLFFLAWEAITVCVYLIASAGGERQDLLDGYLTGTLAKVGGAALLAAFALLYAHTHSFSLEAWHHARLGAGTREVLFALFLVAFGSKVGVLPLQGGLPAGYGSAPRLGAASLSVALGAGFYGLWRFEFGVLGPLPVACGDALLVIAAATALAGISYALTQDDLRRFLGFSTVENTGIALIGFAVALIGQSLHRPELAAAGLLAATLHVAAHNLSKTLALVSIDRVGIAIGVRTLDPLGGLARRLPFTAGTLGVSTLTLAAIPPLGGFVSEWLTFQALLQSFRMPSLLSQLLCALAAATLALTAGLGLLAFVKYYSFIFLGRARSVFDSAHEPSRWPLGAGALAVVILFLGAVAPWEIHLVGAALRPLVGFNLASSTISGPLVLTPVFAGFAVLDPTWLSIVLPAYALLAGALALAGGRHRHVRRAPVWVTGSGADLAGVQYRPSAYSNPMRVIMRGPLGFRSRLRPATAPQTSAPQTSAPRTSTAQTGAPRVLERSVVLAVEAFLYRPLTRLALRVAALVRATQSGHLSTYLIYMLLTLILALSLIPVLH